MTAQTPTLNGLTLEIDYRDPRFEAIDHYFACMTMCDRDDQNCVSNCLDDHMGLRDT